MKIRLAQHADISQIDLMQRQYFEISTIENYNYLLCNDSYKVFIAEIDSKIVGFVSVSISQEAADLLQIYVDKNWRKTGIASALMLYLFEQLEQKGVTDLFLEVNENNKPAINLYSKMGFNLINIRKNYYGKNSALILQKHMN